MDTRKKLLAVINPISGTANKQYIPETITEVMDESKWDVMIRFTQRPGHATDLAKQAIKQGYYGVLAIGGDGTINEVAAALRDSDTALGIIPNGSGNGLARHLNIPIDVKRALEEINNDRIEQFDYCMANQHPFFCTCGVGFDAHVSAKFAESKKRGPMSYLKNTLVEYLRYRSEEYSIETADQVLTERAFVIACGNASQYGNNAFITPNASMQDGLIDVTLIQPFTPLDTAVLGILLFTKHIDQDTNIQSFRTPSLTIHRPKAGVMHIDGEPMMMEADIEVKCVHNGIKIFLPKDGGENKKTFITPIEEGFWNFVTTVRSELNI
ncbi:MAG: diacylglycerol kinase family lipid kinase [Bacteroidales bacterium]|nr:diacylglycerol kinase family lipid kinase [Bacteroidales bacterium]MDD7404262.1 diacylglycerol kinase family lipid kinase [Bacteroidales bacterium]MDY4881689.1 diacylglycerol kinase family lipid kinase [Muribaculaceae bacterium]MDY5119723.1 diacylglycerol kinase family lipid kinase [Muribaculaceae bacterium]